MLTPASDSTISTNRLKFFVLALPGLLVSLFIAIHSLYLFILVFLIANPETIASIDFGSAETVDINGWHYSSSSIFSYVVLLECLIFSLISLLGFSSFIKESKLICFLFYLTLTIFLIFHFSFVMTGSCNP